MAVPGTVSEWREFVRRTPKRPAQLSSREIASLNVGELDLYNQSRFAWLSADIVIATSDVVNVRRLWATLRAETLAAPAMAAKSLSISGSPTFGKTTVSTWIAREHEQAQRARYPNLPEHDFQPSLYVVTPPATTPKMLMTAFCNVLGLPHTRSSTAQELTERVVGVLKTLKTSLVVVDEVHNVQSNRQIGAEAASTLKLFAERLDCAFILAGIDLDRSAVFAGSVGEQLASRSIRYDMRGCANGTLAARDEWRLLVASCGDLLPLARNHDRLLADSAGWLFEVTGGSVGRLRALLRRAALDAIVSGREQFSKADMEAFAHHGGIHLKPEATARAAATWDVASA